MALITSRVHADGSKAVEQLGFNDQVPLATRVIGTEKAIELLGVFLDTEFEGGRHRRRVEKIDRTPSEG